MNQNIDNLFNTELQGLEGNPRGVERDPSLSWTEIEGGLAEKKRRRFSAWWIAIAASVVALVAVTWTLMGPGNAGSKKEFAMHQAPSDSESGQPIVTIPKSEKEEVPKEALERIQQETETTSKQTLTENHIATFNGKGLVSNETSVTSPTLNITSTLNSVKVPSQLNSQTYTWTPANGQNQKAGEYQLNLSINGSDASLQQRISNSSTTYYVDSNTPLEQFKKSPKFAVNSSNFRDLFGGDMNGAEKEGQQGWFDNATILADSIAFIEPNQGAEEYARITENDFLDATAEPLSTFSIDVDRASYSNHRRFINDNSLPPADAVRIEEFVNYFDYDYPQPKGDVPFSINTEVSDCPWNSEHRLVHIGLQGKEIKQKNLPASNLVFLLDVSGSMTSANKLPLLKQAFEMLVGQLREEDKVSIVVYAGAAGLVLKPTSGIHKQTMLDAMNRLEAGGSTAGGAGIELAYATAKKHFVKDGNNRVILATDGDFNVGVSSETGLENLIVKKREEGVFLTVLGLGTGNYKDARMELLADKGNGNFAYIDNLREAKKVMVTEFGGTLFTIAKDVKLQIEFNPAKVKAYRLLGYENRALRNEDFANDKIDAGELGSGHTVTALYEIVPVNSSDESWFKSTLRYQKPQLSKDAFSGELLSIKFRYKKPDENKSKLIKHTVMDANVPLMKTTHNYRWSAAVVEYGLLLRGSAYKAAATYAQVLDLAQSAKGKDKEGYREEFMELVKRARDMKQNPNQAVHR